MSYLKAIYPIRLAPVLFLLMVLGPRTAFLNAQQPVPEFKHIPGVEEYSFGKINAIIQDTYGFLWFSDQTNRCVYKFDGSIVTRFLFDPGNPKSLGGHYPETLAAGEDGVVWIGYGDPGGLDRYDPETESFTHYKHDPDNPQSIIGRGIWVILPDRNGKLWLGTPDGLYQLDPETGNAIHFSHDPNDTTSLSNNQVRSIYEDSEGTLWIGTGVPWNRETGGLNRFDPRTNSFTRFFHDPEDEHSLLGDKVRAIFEDSHGNFWVGTDKNGLHLMDRITGTFTRYTSQAGSRDGLQMPPPGNFMDHITFITEDLEGFLWIGTINDGLIRWDPQSETMARISADVKPAGDYKENSSWCAHVSKDGLIWVASEENMLYKADPELPQINEVPLDDWVASIAERGVEELWLGTDENGLILQNQVTGITKRFRHSDEDPNSLSDDRITVLYLDRENTLWVGTKNGLNRFDEKGNSFTVFRGFMKDSLRPVEPFITDIFEDTTAELWIGTRDGLFRLDRQTGTPEYRDIIRNEDSGPIVKILESNAGELVVSTFNRVFTRDGAQGGFERVPAIDIPNINDVYLDTKDQLWIASNNGVWNSSVSWDTIIPFRLEGTGAYMGDFSFSIAADASDNLWIGTTTGIIKIAAERNSMVSFGESNGVTVKLARYLSTAFAGKNGRIYFASSPNGYYYFDPANFENPVGRPALYMHNLKVNNQPIDPGRGSVGTNSPDAPGALHLSYNQNSFSVTLSAIELRSDFKKKLQYRLENFEDFWKESLSGQQVNYVKVPPGDYTLVFKSPVLNTSDWVEKSLDIHIANPWWKTAWAYTGYALFLFVGIFNIHKYQKRKILVKERNLAKEKELAQAREIRKAYDKLEVAHKNLKSTQTQLIHSEKMASLGELTAGIAHEIQNPLNFVNNFSEVSRELLEEMRDELKKGDTEEADYIAKDLVQNMEKIAHHGQRAGSIVRGMLQHSRSSNGKKESTDLNKLADEYLRMAYHGLRAKDQSFNATLETDFDPDLPQVSVIPQDVGRVLLNLLTNAFHAVNEKKKDAPEGYGPMVTVRTRRTKEGVEIQVTDNGLGIPDKIRDKIFQPFFTTKPTGEGTGLGLSLSYDIIKAHGGELSVTSKIGEGATFTFMLPG